MSSCSERALDSNRVLVIQTRCAREVGIHKGPRTLLRLPKTVQPLFYGKITDWHGESVLQAKIELSAMWLRAQTEGTVLLIGLQTIFGRWPEDSAVSIVFRTSEVVGWAWFL